MLNAMNTHRYRTRPFLSRPCRPPGGSLTGTAADPPAPSIVYVPVAPGSRWDEVAADLRAAGFDVRPAPMPAVRKAPPLPVILHSREG